MDFLKTFTSGRYQRDITILKILASDSKRFRVYGIFKNWQIGNDRGGAVKHNIFLDNFYWK